MGFFDRLFKGGFAFNRMAKAYKEILDCLTTYRLFGDVNNAYRAAWIYYHCVLGSIEKWHWNLFASIYIPDYQVYGRITVQEANLIVMGQLGKIDQRLKVEQKNIIEKIMEGEYIEEVESIIPASIREKLLP
ncbi:MAG: hypothetical protein II293_04150 [Bacteroidaceae bacterium]|jgi:hypothetical protein|nr:hypothetical protein [Bacteroidaceae bacterium]